jgi:hypothetical protein
MAMSVDFSDVPDGFALKKRRGKLAKSKRRQAVKGECTIPPPVAKHILGTFTLDTPVSKRAISDYVETQARDETVLHAERVKSEHILGTDYVCWDVHSDKDRYWVITSPTNLYSQEFFPSLDYTLSFHVGVMARVMARQRGAPDAAHKARLTPVWRRWDDAAASFDAAEETEDFQAVGMKCRVCLLHLAKSLQKPEIVHAGEVPPQKDNFVGWAELIANAIAPGESSARIRSHLKTLSKSTWELVGWLTHANNAVRRDAVFVLDATHSTVAAFGSAVLRVESKAPEKCPNCGSSSLDVGYNPELPRPHVWQCEKCGWRNEEMR